MSYALHCDRTGCDAWQLAPAEAFLTLAGGYSTSHTPFLQPGLPAALGCGTQCPD